MAFPGFERCLWTMRRRDPQVREDGSWLLHGRAAEHLDDLVAAFRAEPEHGLRCWQLELIGAARSPAALDLLVEELHGDDPDLRSWAARGLEQIGTKEARRALWAARGEPGQ